MSWFDTAGFASFAKSALTTAQKTIDKALDIQENTIPNTTRLSDLPVPLSPDVDFFEAFGVGHHTNLSSISPAKDPPVLTERTQVARPNTSSQNSGFWTDTWGSFFETRASVPNVEQPVASVEPKPVSAGLKNIPIVEEKVTVSSQPQRASLFPGEVKPLVSSSQEYLSSGDDSVKKPEVTDIPVAADDSKSDIIEDSNDKTNPVSTDDLLINNELCTTTPESSKPIRTSNVETDNLYVDKNAASDLANIVAVIVEASDHTVTEDTVDLTSEEALVSSNLALVDQQSLDKSDTETLRIDEFATHDISSSKDDSLPCANTSLHISESYVNLECTDLNVPTRYPPDIAEDAETSLIDEIAINTTVPETPNTEPKQLSDSYQILNDSIIQHEGAWVMDMQEECIVPSSSDDHESKNGDSSSNSSGKDYCELDIKSLGSGQSQEMLNSFVKCSLDDIEYVCHRGQSPLSTTASERSDLTKLESEQNTSGDENETTTSSDIEVLSPPNGENTERNSSPLKHIWLPRNVRLRGSESPSSDGSKECMVVSSAREGERFPEELKSGIFYFKSDKDSSLRRYEGIDLDKMFQQQEELQALLDAREKKIMELSTENIKLREEEEKLQNNVRELKLNLAKESQNVSNVTKNLTQKVAQIESHVQTIAKERDELQKQLKDTQHEIVQRISYSQMEETIKEKDQQIKELMDEGQKLSKKELQHLTIIKKLRVKEEETEHNMKILKERLEENSKEVERLRKSLSAKDEQEKTHIDAIRQLTNSVNKMDKEIIALKSNLEDSTEKEIGSKKSLESTCKELTDLHKSAALKDKEIKELKLSVEMAAKEKLKEGLDQANKEANREREVLLMQMEDLRNSLKRCQEETNVRETSLRGDIARLQRCLQESETRNEELTKNISSTSRPLVRQIEALQASYNSQISSCDKIEKSLTDRLNDSQNQLSIALAKEKLANTKYQETVDKMRKIEMQNSTLLQENVQLSTTLEVTNSRIAILEDNKNRNVSTIDSVKHSLNQELKKVKDEKDNISKELENCIELLKEERLLNQNLHDELKPKENKFPSVENISPCFSPTTSLQSSVESINNWTQEEVREKSLPFQMSNVRLSVYDTLTRTGCTTSILENLQSQLKQREGEIAQLQCEIMKLERERESIAQELVTVTEQNEEHVAKLDQLKNVEKHHKDLSQKYNALLQMYNEKVEEYEALLLDLSDVKSAYRKQIEELMQETN